MDNLVGILIDYNVYFNIENKDLNEAINIIIAVLMRDNDKRMFEMFIRSEEENVTFKQFKEQRMTLSSNKEDMDFEDIKKENEELFKGVKFKKEG